MALMVGSASMAAVSSEQELITTARAGDDRAFEELYARYCDRIFAFILGRVRDYGRAEDVAQEVFISALRRLRASAQSVDFKPWIYEIAKNACIDEHRRSQRHPEVPLEVDADLGTGSRAMLSIVPTPPAAAESKQQLDDLRGAFGGLSELHHRLLVMREFEGLSYDEIGTRTDMSRQMVESALFRARRKLGEEYEELASGRRCLQVQSAIASGRLQAARSLGVRERRQLARHLAHCQPCRVEAHLAGADEALTQRRGLGARIAALFPFPVWRLWPWTRTSRHAAIRGSSHPASAQTLQALAAASEPGATAALGGAAVAAALAIAGAGGALAGAPAHQGSKPIRAAASAYPTVAPAPLPISPFSEPAASPLTLLFPAATGAVTTHRLSSAPPIP
ncbi:MAG: sigma-70 family RNA polymerase sigma factor, partial [Actinomycetota bacterium]|nr:sigma-70 family RNA polymerase sigma factor [Actinomycetota bacterium]